MVTVLTLLGSLCHYSGLIVTWYIERKPVKGFNRLYVRSFLMAPSVHMFCKKKGCVKYKYINHPSAFFLLTVEKFSRREWWQVEKVLLGGGNVSMEIF